MDTLIGLSGPDFVMFIADSSQARSIVKMKGNEDKIVQVDESKMFALSGECADRNFFCDYITRNLKLYEYRTGLRLGTHGAAHFARRELADALRKGAYQTNLLLGGIDEEGAQMYFLDYLGTMHKVPFAAHGYAANFVLSIFDRHYKPDLTIEEGLKIAQYCIAELHARFLISQPEFFIKVLSKVDGKIKFETIQAPKEASK